MEELEKTSKMTKQANSPASSQKLLDIFTPVNSCTDYNRVGLG